MNQKCRTKEQNGLTVRKLKEKKKEKLLISEIRTIAIKRTGIV